MELKDFVNSFWGTGIDFAIFVLFVTNKSKKQRVLIALPCFLFLYGYVLISEYYFPDSPLKMLGSLLIFLLVSILLSDLLHITKAVNYTLIYFVVSFLTEISIAGIVWIISRSQNTGMFEFRTVSWVIGLIFSRTLSAIILYRIKTKLVKYRIRFDNRENSTSIIFLLTSSFIIILLVTSFQGEAVNTDKAGRFILGITILFGFMSFVYTLYFYLIISQRRQKEELELLTKEIEYRMGKYEDKLEYEKEVLRLYHDLKNHIIALKGIDDKNSQAAVINEYRGRIEEYINKFQRTEISTGNPVLDIFLSEKNKICEGKGINFEIDIDFSAGNFFDIIDIGTIFGNIIDNAIDACEKTASGGNIKLEAYEDKNCIVIKSRNNINSSKGILGNFVSEKTEKRLHGLGILNIKNCLNKYGGEYTSLIDEGDFIAIILIPIPKSS